MRKRLLNALLFFPFRAVPAATAVPELVVEEMVLETEDGARLHGWWVPAQAWRRGRVLLCHGNGGAIGDRIAHARLLTLAGFDVLLFDSRGYGRSRGKRAKTQQGAMRARDTPPCTGAPRTTASSTSASHSARPLPWRWRWSDRRPG